MNLKSCIYNVNIWVCIPIGRESRLKIYPVTVRVRPHPPLILKPPQGGFFIFLSFFLARLVSLQTLLGF